MFSVFRKKNSDVSESPKSNEVFVSQENTGWLARLKQGLQKSSSAIAEKFDDIFNKRHLDEAALTELEDALIQSDLGVPMTQQIIARLRDHKFESGVSGQAVRECVAAWIAESMQPAAKNLCVDPEKKPHVIMVIGVNGSGKTTTIGKMARQLNDHGHRVMLVAGDTFRAAASAQLDAWAERTENVKFFYKPNVNDPAALAYEALQEARRDGYDVLIVDTAGRLHTNHNLMQELAKIPRVIKKIDESAPHDTLLILDATTGQNAIQQAKHFGDNVPLTGLVITKLDGTARGGVVCEIAQKTKLPVVAIGVGEAIEDLHAFNPADFAQNLLAVK